MTSALDASFAYAPRQGRWADVAFRFGLASIGALLSLAASGLVIFANNNLFHLPIVGQLYDLPQFAQDPFIQSLRQFSSGFWQALAGSDRFVAPETTLIAVWAASRLVAFAGFIACASALGVTERAQQIVFVALLATCDLLLGFSFGGGGGLFFNQGTHSEIANGLLLFSWSFAARGRFAPALALTGAIFFCNSFMAVWNFPALAAVAIHHLRAGRIGLAPLVRDVAAGGAAAAVLAAPVVAMIAANPDFGASPVDYREFLAGYWPKHFLFDSVPGFERLGLALVVLLAAQAFAALGGKAAPFGAIFAGFLALYGAGMLAPLVTSTPFVLNLHLLRSGAALHMLASLAALTLATTWLAKGDLWRSRVLAPALVLSLCALPSATLLGVLALAADRLPQTARAKATAFLARFDGRVIRLAVATTVAASFVAGGVVQEKRNAVYRAWADEWLAVAGWSRSQTDAAAVFLTPTVDLRSPPADLDRARAAANGVVFEYASQRRVWTDFKRGAAVMWSPSYYAEWRTRTDEVLALGSLDERVTYAAARRVGFVVDPCAEDFGPRPVFRTARLCVYPSVFPDLRGSQP